MSNTFFFRNIRNPIGGGGAPLFQPLRGVAFSGTNCLYAFPIEQGAGQLYWEFRPEADPAKTRDWILERFGDSDPQEWNYVPGTAYKRIFRRPVCGNIHSAIDQGKKAQSFVALKILLDKLTAVFQMVEPSTANSAAYGHLIRELLILACMEVEASWSAVLRENGVTRQRLNTTDYIKLLQPMALDTYQLSLSSYQHFPCFTPFGGWDAARATQSLIWYDSYNKTKHDRESNLHLATLENAIHAVGAAVVMFYAQYGYTVESALGEQPVLFIRTIFSLGIDHARSEEAIYIPKMVFEVPQQFPTPSFEWKLVDCPF